MTQKFFYATTTEIPDDGWGLMNDDPDGDVFRLKPTFTAKQEVTVHNKRNPWLSFDAKVVPPGTVMITCWIETEPGIIDLYGDASFFIGDLKHGITPKGGPRDNYIVLPDGRAIQVLSDDLEFVKTLAPSTFGLQSWTGTPVFEKRVYNFD